MAGKVKQRSCRPVVVYANSTGGMTLAQGGAAVLLELEQVDLLTQWLQEIKAEILAGER